MEVKDSNGTLLAEGDSVTIFKDLKIKGSSLVIKRGTVVKNILLTDDPKVAEASVNTGLNRCSTSFHAFNPYMLSVSLISCQN